MGTRRGHHSWHSSSSSSAISSFLPPIHFSSFRAITHTCDGCGDDDYARERKCGLHIRQGSTRLPFAKRLLNFLLPDPLFPPRTSPHSAADDSRPGHNSLLPDWNPSFSPPPPSPLPVLRAASASVDASFLLPWGGKGENEIDLFLAFAPPSLPLAGCRLHISAARYTRPGNECSRREREREKKSCCP